MSSEVIKEFGYAEDHINIKQFVVGDIGDFGDSTEGLTAEGYLKPSKAVDVPAEPDAEPDADKPQEPTAGFKSKRTK